MTSRPFLDFSGKTIVVSGASSGIGKAIAIQLGECGATTVLIGRNKANLEDTAARIAGKCHILCQDLQEHPKIFSTMQSLSKQVGRIYGFCHCAGIVETRPLASFKIESLNTMMGINLVAGLELCRAICRHDIMEENGGSILFISSVYSMVGMPGQIVYSASKGAITAAARAMAMELARRKIRVNVLSPGLVRTHMIEESFAKLTAEKIAEIEKSFPLGTGNPQDVARAAAFLLAPENTWITGTDFVIDGGYTAQ